MLGANDLKVGMQGRSNEPNPTGFNILRSAENVEGRIGFASSKLSVSVRLGRSREPPARRASGRPDTISLAASAFATAINSEIVLKTAIYT